MKFRKQQIIRDNSPPLRYIYTIIIKFFSMKALFSIFISVFLLTMFTNSSCKKSKPDVICGCNSNDTKYSLQNINGTLAFYQYKSKWVIYYQPIAGNYSYYFPCNTNQDSLQTILQGANQNQVFPVKFSGKIKSTCPDEDFGFTIGVTTFDYLILDSLKRN